MPPSGAVLRSCAYTPAKPASTSASSRKKCSDAIRLGGFSVRSVHPWTGSSSSVASPAAPSDMVTESLFISLVSLEQKTQAAGDGAGPRIGEVVETTCRQAVRCKDLGVEARIPGEQDQVISRNVQTGTARRACQHRQVEIIPDRDVLQAYERSIFDPARRVDSRFANAGRVGQRGPQEIAAPGGVALAGIDERRVVEHVLSYRGADQKAQVEPVPVHFAMDAERKIGIGVADDAVIVLGRSESQRRPSADAARCDRRAFKYLLAGGVHAREDRSIECTDRRTRDEAFGNLIGLPLSTHESRGDEALVAQIHDLGPLGGEYESRSPREVGSRDRERIERDLEAVTAQATHVLQLRRVQGRLRHIDRE